MVTVASPPRTPLTVGAVVLAALLATGCAPPPSAGPVTTAPPTSTTTAPVSVQEKSGLMHYAPTYPGGVHVYRTGDSIVEGALHPRGEELRHG